MDRVAIWFDGPYTYDALAPMAEWSPGIEYYPTDGSDPVGFRLTEGGPRIYTPGGSVLVIWDAIVFDVLGNGFQAEFNNATRQAVWHQDGLMTPGGLVWDDLFDPPVYSSPLTAWMTRSAGNKDGEFFHLPPAGLAQIVIYGWPTRCRLQWFPTYS